jgi:hypothetical protein
VDQDLSVQSDILLIPADLPDQRRHLLDFIPNRITGNLLWYLVILGNLLVIYPQRP